MRNPIRWLQALALAMLLSVLTACGGSLGPPSGELTRAVAFKIQWLGTTPTTTKTSVQIGAAQTLHAAWPGVGVTRDTAPTVAAVDAHSAQITLPKADKNGNDVIIVATRDTSPAAPPIQIYYPPVTIKVGTRTVQAIFLDTSGKKLTEIDTTVNVTAAGGVLNLTTSQQPDHIIITPGQSVQVTPYRGEQPTILKFVATLGTGADRQIMAINPLNVNIKIPDGTNLLRVVPNPNEIGSPLDSLQGLQSGQANVQVQIGSTTSDPESVLVFSSTHVVVNPQQLGQNNEVTGNVPYTFTAKVTPPTDAVPQNITLANGLIHDSNLDVIWSIREVNQGRLNVDPNNPNSVQYIPPARSGTYHLIATSVYDKGLSAVSEVKVTLGSLDILFQP